MPDTSTAAVRFSWRACKCLCASVRLWRPHKTHTYDNHGKAKNTNSTEHATHRLPIEIASEIVNVCNAEHPNGICCVPSFPEIVSGYTSPYPTVVIEAIMKYQVVDALPTIDTAYVIAVFSVSVILCASYSII